MVSLLILVCISSTVLAQDIFEAVKKNDMALVKSLLERNPELIKARDGDGRTPLHRAARATPANLELINLLIEKKVDVNVQDNSGVTALHSVARRAQREAVALLIAQGAELNVKDNTGNTPLFYAAVSWPFGYKVKPENQEVVRLLVEKGALPPTTGEEAYRLLHRAALCGYKELAERMIELGVELMKKDPNEGTLLHSSAAGGLSGTVDMLIKKGFGVNVRNRYGLTPLHLAAIKGNKDIVELLIANGADINVRCPVGKSPLNYAEEAGNQGVVQVLMASGADKGPPEFPVLKGKYLGQKKPGRKPELFALGIISTMFVEHSTAAFSPDAKELFWSPVAPKVDILYMRSDHGQWLPSQPALFSTAVSGAIPTFSPDGQKVFMCAGSADTATEIFYVERKKNGWTEARSVGSRVNTGSENTQTTADREGALYFASFREGGKGSGDIYCSKLINGEYAEPENLGNAINTVTMEYSPFIAFDGSYLIFCASGRPDGLGGMDLYISFREKDGTWGQAVNMGETINTLDEESFPSVTADGKYLFFGSDRNGNYDICWADAKIIDELRLDVLEKESIHIKGPYLGQKPPGMAPEIFAPGIVSSAEYEHGAPAFSHDGKELYWSVVDEKELRQEIRFMKAEREHWSKPAKVSFADARFVDGNPVFSPDGRKLYFTSNRPFSPGGEARGSELWIWEVERRGDGWSPPKPLDANFNQVALAAAPSFSTAGTLFLTPWKGSGLNPFDIFYCLYQEGRYSLPISVGHEINSSDYEAYPFIAADESYLIFESQREGGEGKLDLYISFRNADGTWTKARSMGGKINSSESDRFPCVTPDGKHLFFASDRNGNFDYYWVDARIIDELRPRDLK